MEMPPFLPLPQKERQKHHRRLTFAVTDSPGRNRAIAG